MNEGYYLANFIEVLGDVERRYGDLLLPEERATLLKFRGLSQGARRLYVRMLTRKGPWFRLDALRYSEIGEPGPFCRELVDAGFCRDRPELEEILPLLKRPDLIELLEEQGLDPHKGLKRDALLLRLVESLGTNLEFLLRRIPVVAPTHHEFWQRVFLLFFGNFEQDLSTFVVAEMGHVRYESYPLDAGLRLFQTRRDVDFLLSVRALREQLETLASEMDLSALTREVLGMETHPGIRQQRRYQGLLNALGKAWERVRNPVQALACFERSERPPARERRIRILAAQGRLEEAGRLALEVAEAPRDVGEERFARKFMERRSSVAPAFQAWLQAHPEPSLPTELHIEVVPHSEGVERAALEAAREEGWGGFFAENYLWRALFGLAFWDPFFAAVPGAFQHRFQNAPQDFGRPDFHLHRQSALDQRLAELENSRDLAGLLLEVADGKWGLAHAYLNWRHLQRAQLEAALARIEPRQLSGVLKVMVRNPRAFDSGFPDLFLYRPGTAEWQLWEVKGPGDQLRPEQEFWQRTFVGLGCVAQVVRVKFRG